MKVNTSYIGTGADQPCPVEPHSKNGMDSTSCDPANYIELRSDGRFRSKDEGGLSATFDSFWDFTGSFLNTVTKTGNDAKKRVVASFQVTNAGIIGGRQRLRLRTASETEDDGTTLRPDDVNFELVIEELP